RAGSAGPARPRHAPSESSATSGSTRSGPGSRPLVRRVPWRLRDLFVRLRLRLADRADGAVRAGRRPVFAAAAAAGPEAGTRRGAEPVTPAGVLADPRVRLGAGTAALLVTAMASARTASGRTRTAA